MARKSIEQRLAELDAQRATLKARLGKQERANDTRRKVLLGALVLHRLEHGRDELSRALPDWPYNLFAMLHGESQEEVEAKRAEVASILGAACRGHDILYSTRILKKTGMRLRDE